MFSSSSDEKPSITSLTPPSTTTGQRSLHLTQQYLAPFLLALLPSPLAARLRHGRKTKPTTTTNAARTTPAPARPAPHKTAYLDGLRGLASLFVFLCHVTSIFTGQYMANYDFSPAPPPPPPSATPPQDAQPPPLPSNPIQLPFIRVIFTGNAWVHVFFVISGYALSLKPLRCARSRDFSSLLTTLSSLIVRRAFRLFLPAFGALVISHIILGADRSETSGIPLAYGERIQLWVHRCGELLEKSWQWDSRWQSAPLATWTLPVEFCMSFLLVVVLAGFGASGVGVRMVGGVVVGGWCVACGRWAGGEFLGGMVLAEWGIGGEDGGKREGDGEGVWSKRSDGGRERLKKILWSVFCWSQLVCGLWICGWPDFNVDKAPGLKVLYAWTPEPYRSWGGDDVARPWFALAALQIVFACQQLRPLQRVLNTSVVQYLGKVSFALYLTHPIGIAAYGLRVMPYVQRFFQPEGEAFWGLFATWVVGVVALGVPAFWAADIFMRAVDSPSVKIARWVDGKCKQTATATATATKDEAVERQGGGARGGLDEDIELQAGNAGTGREMMMRELPVREEETDRLLVGEVDDGDDIPVVGGDAEKVMRV